MSVQTKTDDQINLMEDSLKNLNDILSDQSKFNEMSLSLWSSIPFDTDLGKRNLMIMISESLDVGNQIEIDSKDSEEFVDSYITNSKQ